jgi:hypothetical protein
VEQQLFAGAGAETFEPAPATGFMQNHIEKFEVKLKT